MQHGIEICLGIKHAFGGRACKLVGERHALGFKCIVIADAVDKPEFERFGRIALLVDEEQLSCLARAEDLGPQPVAAVVARQAHGDKGGAKLG